MTFVPGGIPGAPRNAEIMRQYGKAKQQEFEAEAAADQRGRGLRPSRLRRLLRRGRK